MAEISETLEITRRVHPAKNPDAKTIAEFHELHAKHERNHGRIERAEEAERRAARARARGSSLALVYIAALEQAGKRVATPHEVGEMRHGEVDGAVLGVVDQALVD